MKWKWTLILILIIIADSFLTIYNGVETTPMILSTMDFFNLSLKTAMYLRLLYIAPFVYIVHKWNYSKITTLAYIGIYITESIFGYMLDLGIIV